MLVTITDQKQGANRPKEFWCPLRGFDALRVYQLAALIEAVPRISLNRHTVKMHQRPTL